MKKSQVVGRLLIGLAALSLSSVALSQSQTCTKDEGTGKYCICLYDKALEDMNAKPGYSFEAIKQRAKAAQKALTKCFSTGSDEAFLEIDQVK